MEKVIKIKATFTGLNGSCGFKTNEQYTLTLTEFFNGSIKADDNNGNRCDYYSFHYFLQNWKDVSKVTEQESKEAKKNGLESLSLSDLHEAARVAERYVKEYEGAVISLRATTGVPYVEMSATDAHKNMIKWGERCDIILKEIERRMNNLF